MTDQEPLPEEDQNEGASSSPPWDRTIKIFVAVATLLIIYALARRFTDLLLQIVAAAIIAYVITPLIDFVNARTRISKSAVIIIIYLLIFVGLIWLVISVGTTAVNQSLALLDAIPTFVGNVVEWLSSTTELGLGPYTIDVASFWENIDKQALEDQVLSAISGMASQTGRTIFQVISSTVQIITTLLFTLIISVYMAFEIPKLGGYVQRLARQPGYSADAQKLTREFGRIWRAYLRGQVILGLIIGLGVSLALSILGVQNSLALGALSGLLEFLPVIGPFIGTAAAALVAFFQPQNYMGLEPVTYALIVIGVMMLIQQIENNILVPRIVGGALNLHPLIVIVGVFAFGSLAGLIGAILAAPTLATSKLTGLYAWRKMFDLPPFPLSGSASVPAGPGFYRRLANRIKELRAKLT